MELDGLPLASTRRTTVATSMRAGTGGPECACACVCVCEKERERVRGVYVVVFPCDLSEAELERVVCWLSFSLA